MKVRFLIVLFLLGTESETKKFMAICVNTLNRLESQLDYKAILNDGF